MPGDPLIWRHVVLSTRGSWLPGDPRGFRNRDHRLHSSGDYKTPPPVGEHLALHRAISRRCAATVTIPADLRERVGLALLEKLRQFDMTSLTLAICGQHAHWLASLPVDPQQAKRIVAQCKGYASFTLRDSLPGGIWAVGGAFHPIADAEHYRNTFYYIRDKQPADAWVWSADGNLQPFIRP